VPFEKLKRDRISKTINISAYSPLWNNMQLDASKNITLFINEVVNV